MGSAPQLGVTMRICLVLAILSMLLLAHGQLYLGPFRLPGFGIFDSFFPGSRVDIYRPGRRPTTRQDYSTGPDYYGGDANHGLFKRSLAADPIQGQFSHRD